MFARGGLSVKLFDAQPGAAQKARDSIAQSLGRLVEKGKTAITRQRDQVAAAVEAGKQAYRESVSDNSPVL